MTKITRTISAIVMTALPQILLSQEINVIEGIQNVKTNVRAISTELMELITYICGIGAIVGLVITLYKLYTEEHGNWSAAFKWLGAAIVFALGVVIIKTMYFK